MGGCYEECKLERNVVYLVTLLTWKNINTIADVTIRVSYQGNNNVCEEIK